MKSTHLLVSLVTLSALGLGSACSSSDSKDSGGAGGSTSTGGKDDGGTPQGSGGKGAGGKTGTTKDGGTPDGSDVDSSVGNGGTSGDGSVGAGGAPITCPGVNLLTDETNCGSCGRNCGSGQCLDGLCEAELVMDAQYQVYSYNTYSGFVSGGKVYEWEYTTANPANDSDSLVLSAPTTPGTPVTQGDVVQDLVINSGGTQVASVAFDPTYVYTAMGGTPVGQKGFVARKKLDRSENTGAGTKVFALPAGPLNPDGNKPSNLKWSALAVGTDGIYVAGTTQINGSSNPVPDHTSIYRIALPLTADATKEPTVLIPNRGEKITDLSVFGNATAGQHLFWLEYNPARADSDAGPGTDYFIFTAPTSGGTPVVLDDVNTSASAIASDGTYVYWTECNSLGRLMRAPLAHLTDSSEVEAVTDLQNAQEGLAILGDYAYAMELADPGPVFRINTKTGAKDQIGNRTIGPSEKETTIIGVDATHLYMTGLDAKVFRLFNSP